MSAPISLAIENALAPADVVRRRALRWLGPLASPIMTSRELRVALMGVGVVVFALAGTLVAPLWLLALGPIVLGVPHILSDVRYLWVRPGFDRRLSVCIAIGGPLLLGLTMGRLWGGLLAVVGALVVARTSHARRALGLAGAGLLLLGAWRLGGFADIVFAHAHNLIAIALWWRWRPRTKSLHYVPLAAIVAGCALLLALDPFSVIAGTPALGPGWSRHVTTLAPGMDRAIGLRLVLLFCFAQSVHYGIWLRLVPEEDRERETPRTFAASFRVLLADLGPTRIAVFALLIVGLAVWACVNLAAARSGYLRFAVFHGQLELAAAALLWAEGKRGSCSTAG